MALIPLLGVGCSGWLFDEKSEAELAAEAAVAESVDAEPVGSVQEDLQSRFDLVRVLPHPEGSIYPYTAFVSLPKASGDTILSRLELLCSCDDRMDNPAILELTKDGGGTILGAVSLGPAGETIPEYRAIEDILMIRGTEADIEEVLVALDVWFNSTPQIEIQATVFEITNLDAFERGVEGLPLLDWGDQTTLVQSLVSTFKTAGSSGGIIELAFTDGDFNLSAGISLLEQVGLLEVLSTPSIVTRNGVPATMRSIEQVPYLTPSGFSATGVTNFKIEQREIGITLHVVPFLVGADTIHMVIDAKVSRLGRDIFVGVDSSGQAISAPSTTERSATTTVYVKNGTEFVFGGLTLTDMVVEERRVPFIGAIPLIGWLFSSREETTVQTQVFFRIKPTVRESQLRDPIGDIFDPFADE